MKIKTEALPSTESIQTVSCGPKGPLILFLLSFCGADEHQPQIWEYDVDMDR